MFFKKNKHKTYEKWRCSPDMFGSTTCIVLLRLDFKSYNRTLNHPIILFFKQTVCLNNRFLFFFNLKRTTMTSILKNNKNSNEKHAQNNAGKRNVPCHSSQ